MDECYINAFQIILLRNKTLIGSSFPTQIRGLNGNWYFYLKLTGINGVFCISLDYEKYWGIRDVVPVNELPENFGQIDALIQEILKLFTQYDIHATWAFVGLLAFETKDDLLASNTGFQIPYDQAKYSPYPIDTQNYGVLPFDFLSGYEQLKKIRDTKNQELASHTYAHYYTLEKGQGEADFNQDLVNMGKISGNLSLNLAAIVFPRNQLNLTYLEKLKLSGYRSFRGNQENKFWRNSIYENESFFKKAGRYTDAYFAISKTRAYGLDNLPESNGMLNIPASRFLRPHSGKNWLEKRKLERIKNEMTKAAKENQVYHLWWHPHNFLSHPTESLLLLEEILKHYQTLKNVYNFQSMNMTEIAQHARS